MRPDHATGAIIWARPGRNAATLAAFFDALGDRKLSIRAVSIDMSAGYENAVKAAIPDAEIAFDPFDVVKLANAALNQVRRADWNTHAKSTTSTGRWLKGVRWALIKAPERLTASQQTKLARGPDRQPRPLARLPAQGRAARALPPARPLVRRRPPHGLAGLGRHAASSARSSSSRARSSATAPASSPRSAGGLSNARLEGLNSKVCLISHRSFGFHGPDPLIALIYLCAGGITIDPPFTTNS